MDVFITRRPVLDRFGKVYGYKLVHSRLDMPPSAADTEDSALQLIDRSVLVFNLDTIAAGKRVFFTFTKEALDTECAELLPRESVVVDLHESLWPTDDTVASCQRLKESGYLIAAPLREPDEPESPLLQFADIVGLDFRAWPDHDLRRGALARLGRGRTVLGRSVNSLEDYRCALDLGCTYVEGDFISTPTAIVGRDVGGFKPNYLQLMHALNTEQLDFRRLSEIITREVSMTFKLLRLVNSASFGLRAKVSSIDRALLVLGERGIRQWASVIAVAELSAGTPSELITTSAVRARFCQLIGEAVRTPHRGQDLFLMGLFSLLDAITGRPLPSLLDDVGLDGPVKDALNGADNDLRPVLDLVLAYESGDWSTAAEIAARLGIARGDLAGIYLPAVEWANSSVAIAA